MKKLERIAKSIAWAELTPHGRKVCVWPTSFSLVERKIYRKMARFVIKELEMKDA